MTYLDIAIELDALRKEYAALENKRGAILHGMRWSEDGPTPLRIAEEELEVAELQYDTIHDRQKQAHTAARIERLYLYASARASGTTPEQWRESQSRELSEAREKIDAIDKIVTELLEEAECQVRAQNLKIDMACAEIEKRFLELRQMLYKFERESAR